MQPEPFAFSEPRFQRVNTPLAGRAVRASAFTTGSSNPAHKPASGAGVAPNLSNRDDSK
jgi:hypothetical protein